MTSLKRNPHTPHISRGADGLWRCDGGEFRVIGYGYDWRQAWDDWKDARDRRLAEARRPASLTFTLGSPPEEHHHV